MLARIGEALDSEIVSLGVRARCTCGSPAAPRCRARSTSSRARTPGSPCCARRCSTRAAPRCARSPGSRRSTGSSRCSTASASRPAGSTRTTTSRSSPPAELDLTAIDEEAARRTRSDHHVPRPAAAPTATQFELPYAGGCDLGTRTVEPHMSALRPFGLEVKATEGSYHAQVDTSVVPTRPDRADRARRHRHRERPAGRRPAPRHHRDPQRQPQLHGPGPLLLPARSSASRSTASAPPR